MAARGGSSRGRWFAKKTPCAHGHVHDSGKEARHCERLHLRQAAGEIRQITVHPEYRFSLNGAPIKVGNGQHLKVTFDWHYFEGEQAVVEELKGAMVSRDWPVRMAIFRAFYPYIELRVVKA